MCQLVYQASNKLGGCDVLARKVGVQSWEIFQWIAGRNLPKGHERAVLLQALTLLTIPVVQVVQD